MEIWRKFTTNFLTMNIDPDVNYLSIRITLKKYSLGMENHIFPFIMWLEWSELHVYYSNGLKYATTAEESQYCRFRKREGRVLQINQRLGVDRLRPPDTNITLANIKCNSSTVLMVNKTAGGSQTRCLLAYPIDSSI